MPTPTPIRRAIYTATLLGWVIVIAKATPLGAHISDDVRQVAILIACIGSFKWLARRMHAPAHELYAAGKAAGRAEALAEQRDGVVRLDERRLRVVGGSHDDERHA